MMKTLVHNVQTGEISEIEMTKTEIATFAAARAENEAKRAEEIAAAEIAAAKKAAILDALATAIGLDADELRDALNA